MAYTYFTFAQAKTALAKRLYDTGKVFFTDAELGVYIKEAMQAFNALGNFYRQEFTFTTIADLTWYDITDAVNFPNTTRPMTMTDTDLVSAIEYHLLEPQTVSYPLTWTGSLQFNISDLLNAIQQSRDEILSETGCTLNVNTYAALPGRTFLPDSLLDLRRVIWDPVTGLGYSLNILFPSDLWATQTFEAGFPQNPPGIPQMYRRSTEPPLGFDVDVQPAVPGSYEVLTVDAGPTLSSAAASVMPIPNDWLWVNKYGALAQLFGRDNLSADPMRFRYSMMRYKQGLTAMRQAPALLAARINNVPVIVDAVTSADFYDANWQGAAHDTPTAAYYAGLNMVALNPTPSTSPASVTASVISNMPLPAADGDFIQLGRDDIYAVLDEAQHIAMIKCGGTEFTETFPLHMNFLRRITLYNSKLNAMSLFLEFLDGKAQEDNRIHPTFQGADPQTVEQ